MLTIFIEKAESGHHVRLSSDDRGAFHLAIDSLKSFIQSGYRSYNPATKQWFIDEDATYSLQRWSAYCRNVLHAQAEWIDGEIYEDEYADNYSHRPPPRKPRGVESEHEAYQVLHLLPSAPAPLIKAAYRELAKIKHPDHGGDDEEMKRINSAFDVLKGRLAA
jgi:hypothetical protein